MSVGDGSPLLTVAILTYNGETYLRRILESVSAQKLEGGIEILVIDSGSTDDTLNIVRDFPDVRLEEISNSEFGHGRTRNLAARLGCGEFIAYLTHDAIPTHDRWAAEMLAPFELSSRIVAVMGKQVPRPNCFPLLKYEIEDVFAGLGSDLGITSYELRESDRGNEGLIAAKAFYSDVNSMVRRNFLVKELPYRDVRYAEDQLFGRDVLEAGFVKAYSPGGSVEHSNDLTLTEYGLRIFDETVALREIGRDVQPLSRRTRFRLIVRGILRDSGRIMRDRAFSRTQRLYWLVVNPLYHLRKWKYHNIGARLVGSEVEAAAVHSLEAQRKRISLTKENSRMGKAGEDV